MDIVVFDLETTGLSPYVHEIIQIAGVRMRVGRVLENEDFATFVRPHHRIPPFIERYTGISNAHVQNAPKGEDALQSFSRFVGSATLIAHNGKRFDMPFIRESCARHGLPVRPVGFVDSMALSQKLWGGRGGHGLDAVMGRLQLSANGARRHDARGDMQILAEAVRRMWGQLTNDFHACPVSLGAGCHAGLIICHRAWTSLFLHSRCLPVLQQINSGRRQKTRALKQAMMQELPTGRIRLI